MKKISLRIWILIIVLVLALLAIKPSFKSGVVIASVEQNSTAFEQGLRSGELIKAINGQKIKTLEDYTLAIEKAYPELEIKTETKTKIEKEIETKNTSINNSIEETINKTKIIITTKNNEYVLFTDKAPEITVKLLSKTRIKTGLDLQGGARALVKPEKKISAKEMNDLITVSTNRFNVYGISDVKIRAISDLSANRYMLVEIAGATPSDLEELISKQGKFEAKIGNETVFIGGEKDITYVARTGQEAGIETCFDIQGGQACRFRFVIYLSEQAAKRHAQITSKLGVNTTDAGRYLDKKLDLYLDDKLVDSLFISEDLKGRETTQIMIQGSGVGPTRSDAVENTQDSMQKLQTILITGSLPFKLEIVKLDTISPLLGQKFIKTIFIAGLSAVLCVGFVVLLRYRKIKASIALLFTSCSEVFIVLGIAALINWNLDLPSIAGILAVIGTGVDQQIVILDESKYKIISMKERLKRALFIIVAAYFTSVVALLPLWWAGAGLLKGFAITTIIGITSGVLITRPAFADMIKRIEE